MSLIQSIQMKCGNPWWLFVVLLTIIIAIQSYGKSYRRDENTGVYFASFVKNPSLRLNVSVLAIPRVSDQGKGNFECINNRQCYSVNFAASLDGRPSCELLNTGDKFNNADHLVGDQRFDHYNIKVSAKLLKAVVCMFQFANMESKVNVLETIN